MWTAKRVRGDELCEATSNFDGWALMISRWHTVSLDADELELVCELGRGAYGDVHKMREKKTGAELAVKRIR